MRQVSTALRLLLKSLDKSKRHFRRYHDPNENDVQRKIVESFSIGNLSLTSKFELTYRRIIYWKITCERTG